MRAIPWRAVGAVALVVGGLAVAAPPAGGVDTDIAISTTSIDFGEVNVGTTATVPVTLTNTGGDPFGPINIFGGAPPSAEFNASQNCQAQTLPAGGSCSITYIYAPTSTGTHTDTSSFTISETTSQSDGENFSVSLRGMGCDPNACTPTTTAAPTTTVATPTTLAPNTPTNPPPPNSVSGGGNTGTTLAPVAELRVEIEHDKVAPGQEQEAEAKGFQPNELVTGTSQPDGRVIGTVAADADGEVEFTWIVAEADGLGPHEFVASGAVSGSVSTPYEIVATAAEADDDDAGVDPWFIVFIVVVVLAAIVAAVMFAYRRERSSRDEPPAGDAGPHAGAGAEPEPPPDPDAPTQEIPRQ